MQLTKHFSITRSVTLLTLLSVLLVILVTLLILLVSFYFDKRTIALKSIALYTTLQNNPTQLKSFLQKEQLVSTTRPQDFDKDAKHVLIDPIMRDAFYSGKIILYEFHNHYIIQILQEHNSLWFTSTTPLPTYRYYILLALCIVAALLYLLYHYVFSSIKPLKQLEKSIKRFTHTQKLQDTRQPGSDEVSNIANAFYDAMRQIERLSEARELFYRNIMHEFKTPLTRATLSAHMLKLDDGEQKNILLDQFALMQKQLDALEQCERLSSNLLTLTPKKQLFVDLLDDALEQLEIASDRLVITCNYDYLQADFSYFSLALKNLLDNAHKYTSNDTIHIRLTNKALYIYNQATRPTLPIHTLTQAFKQDKKHFQQGMGLGLYIVSEIVQKHGMKFQQRYLFGYFVTKITFPSL